MRYSNILVVVLNYRGQEVLLPCLGSLMPELRDGDRCLIVDNGNEEELLQEVKNIFPQIETQSLDENVGFARGMNVGLKKALEEEFSAVWLLNNDTLVKRGALEALRKAAEEHPGVHLFSPLIFTSDERVWFAGGRVDYWRMRTTHVQSLPDQENTFSTDFLTGCALFIPRRTLEQVGILDERYFLYYEDVDYSVRVRGHGGSLWVVPRARVTHHEVSVLNPDKIYWLVRSGVEFFLRHTPWPLRIWTYSYLGLRRLKNIAEHFFFRRALARSIKQAYTDASIK